MSFPGGGFFLPARNAHDWRVLIGEVAEHLRAAGQVQILVNDQRWMVRQRHGAVALCCTRCGGAVDAAQLSSADDTTVYCHACTPPTQVRLLRARRHPQRQAAG